MFLQGCGQGFFRLADVTVLAIFISNEAMKCPSEPFFADMGNFACQEHILRSGAAFRKEVAQHSAIDPNINMQKYSPA